MNERQMHYICAIADTGSIQKAGILSGKNSSTLTRGLKSCENELGVLLFQRTKSKLIPTSEGKMVIEFARKILEETKEIRSWAQSRNGDGETAKAEYAHEWSENEIQYLLTIREWKNISKAAEELYLAQPSLSQMIRELEEEMGHRVFVRGRDGASETGFGTELIDRLEKVHGLFGQIRVETEEFQQMKRGTITFGIPLNLGTYLLPLIVPAFNQQFPGIKIRIRENNSRDLEQLMIRKKIDFCILHFYEEKKQVRYELFFEDPFYLVVPGTLKSRLHFPEDRKLTGEELLRLEGEPFVMVARRQRLRLVVDQILENVGITPDICCTTKSMETAKRLAAAGMGVTFLPRSYLTLYSEVGGLACYPLCDELNGSWKLAVACPQEGKLPRSSREFLKLLKNTLRQISENNDCVLPMDKHT